MKKIIVLDTETTGLSQYMDDILQLSIIDDEGYVLFNDYFKPVKKTSWKQAEAIHHISLEMVANQNTFAQRQDEIQAIIDDADVIVGYNVTFDLNFLKEHGIYISGATEIVDVMKGFGFIIGNGRYTKQKLSTCADYYGYVWEDAAHNALADAKATLYCYKCIVDKNG